MSSPCNEEEKNAKKSKMDTPPPCPRLGKGLDSKWINNSMGVWPVLFVPLLSVPPPCTSLPSTLSINFSLPFTFILSLSFSSFILTTKTNTNTKYKMAEPGYPQDHKDPSVFVDMSSHSHEDDNDLSNSAPPPPFSDHADEDAVPLLSAADEKEALDQKNASAVPIPEDQNQNQQQKVCGRRWGRRCNRTPEQRAACKL